MQENKTNTVNKRSQASAKPKTPKADVIEEVTPAPAATDGQAMPSADTSSPAKKPTAAKKTTAPKSGTAAKPTSGAKKTTTAKSGTTAKAATAGKSNTTAKSATTAKTTTAKATTAKKTATAKKATPDTSAPEDTTVSAETAAEAQERVSAADTVATTETAAINEPTPVAEVSAAQDIAEQATAEKVSAQAGSEEQDPLLRVEGLKKYFAIQTNFFGKPKRYLKAVDDVSFSVKKGETIGVVGESGCGKTTLGRTILKLHESNGGKIYFDGNDITDLKKKQMLKYRTDIQLIFQDPYSSLPPRMTVGRIIAEAVCVHKIVPKDQVHSYVLEVMKQCGLQPQYYDRYPHEFSGGQRQRICIARALAVKPRLVICDEPVSALDVSIQAQIINLLKDLQKSIGLTYVFISHDLSVVKYITDQILVMYLGNSMELGGTDAIFDNPLHPYTQALFSAVPAPDPTVKMKRIILEGDIPSPANPPEGCKFHTRCAKCMNVCRYKVPQTIEAEPNHFVTCHLYDKEVMANLSAYDEEYANIQEERRRKQEEERIKKENAKLYRFKTKTVKLFKRAKSKIVGLFKRKDGNGASPEDSGIDSGAADRIDPRDGNAAASDVGATEPTVKTEEKEKES